MFVEVGPADKEGVDLSQTTSAARALLSTVHRRRWCNAWS